MPRPDRKAVFFPVAVVQPILDESELLATFRTAEHLLGQIISSGNGVAAIAVMALIASFKPRKIGDEYSFSSINPSSAAQESIYWKSLREDKTITALFKELEKKLVDLDSEAYKVNAKIRQRLLNAQA